MRVRLLVAAILGAASPSPAAGQFTSVRISVIDVGQADGILVRTPNQRWILIDAGLNDLLADSLGPHFGVNRLALVIASHRHRDHIGGMAAVLNRYPTDRFVGNLADCPDQTLDDSVRAALTRHGIPAQSVGADTLVVDGVRIIVLAPDPTADPCPSRENNNTVVVRLEFGQFSMLFAGDAEIAERGWLATTFPGLVNVTVLKASHHGANNGVLDGSNPTSPDTLWLRAVRPQHVVISAGVNGNHKHPMPRAVAEYDTATGLSGKVHCTNRHQTVTVYGYPDGRLPVVRRMLTNAKPCTYDGTHY